MIIFSKIFKISSVSVFLLLSNFRRTPFMLLKYSKTKSFSFKSVTFIFLAEGIEIFELDNSYQTLVNTGRFNFSRGSLSKCTAKIILAKLALSINGTRELKKESMQKSKGYNSVQGWMPL